MKKSWLKFTWRLGQIQQPEMEAIQPFLMRPALPEEEGRVLETLSKSTALDSSLGEAGRLLQYYFAEIVPRTWKHKKRESLVVLHGERIIGASVFFLLASEPYQLASGPCVLSEYRNRGLGTALLQATLWELQKVGLDFACGICHQFSTLAKYLYPKFGGASEFVDFEISSSTI
ncbi:MAG: GNAT family N-acetyltransferase [Chthoniobacterales bacterium]|nr:GNAT family N-acetyltransferase [Chthoniobacterales bacterium]